MLQQRMLEKRRKMGMKSRNKGQPKQFCPYGHNKDIVGRTETGSCVECSNMAAWKKQLKKYGLTTEDYNKLVEQQNGKCLICKIHRSKLKRALAIDHNHITNKVRGLLCTSCNLGLGFFKDNPEYLLNAINYLQKEFS